MSELDEMQAKWADYNTKLDTSIKLSQQILTEKRLGGTKWRLHWVTFELALEIAGNSIATLLIGQFAFAHRTEAKYLVPAILLQIFAIAILNGNVRQCILASTIDYSKPIVTIQKQVERLQVLRANCTKWTLICSPLVWVLLAIVSLKYFVGVDAYQVGANVIVANILFGLSILVLGFWLSRRYKKHPKMQALMGHLAGSNLAKAVESLESLELFEAER